MTAQLEMPASIARLGRNKAGYPIPWFVDRDADVDGQPDFRIADSRKLLDAIRFDLCWVCGHRRGRYGSFVVGPMCAVNRTSAEPPCHLDCAVYSAKTCPFLVTPRMRRRDSRLPDGHVEPAGVMISRNPGVALVWTSRTFAPYPVDNGTLFDLGEPTDMRWYAQGRKAEPAEILASMESGMPTLMAIAAQDGKAAVAELAARYAQVKAWVLL